MELLHEPRPTSSEFDAARLASLSALQAMSAWGTSTGLPRAVDILTDMPASQRDPRASDSGHKALSVVMVEAEFESGSLRDIIVALFQRPDTPPALAEVACAMLVNFWRDAASLQVLLRAVNAGSTACAALASFRRHRRSEPQAAGGSRGEVGGGGGGGAEDSGRGGDCQEPWRGGGLGDDADGGVVPGRVACAIEGLQELIRLEHQARLVLAQRLGVEKQVRSSRALSRPSVLTLPLALSLPLSSALCVPCTCSGACVGCVYIQPPDAGDAGVCVDEQEVEDCFKTSSRWLRARMSQRKRSVSDTVSTLLA